MEKLKISIRYLKKCSKVRYKKEHNIEHLD